MGRRVFISFLGTNNYLQVKYKFGDGHIEEPLRFIQEAIVRHECDTWNPNKDKIIIFLTKEAREKNWNNNGQGNIQEDKEIENIGLETRLINCLGPDKYKKMVKSIGIADGFSEQEVWTIFDTVYKELKKEDIVYFDVTHAFRSIPMFSMVLFNYAQYMADVKIKSIQYGAFEKLGPAYEVKKTIPKDERIAPVLDLTNIINLQNYTNLASGLHNYGRMKAIAKNLSGEKTSNYSKTINDISKDIEELDNCLQRCDLKTIKEGSLFDRINNNFKKIDNIKDLPEPIKKLLHKLQEDLSGFSPDGGYDNVEAAINWAIKYHMLQQAYTMAKEYYALMLYDIFEEDNPYKKGNPEKRKKDYVMYLSSLASISEKAINNPDELYNDLGEHRSTSVKLVQHEIFQKLAKNTYHNKIRNPYSLLCNNRNELDHANRVREYSQLERVLPSLIKQCGKIIKPYLTKEHANKSI